MAPPAVVDTNVVVAGLITPTAGAPTARLLEAMLRGERTFLLSLELLSEWNEVLRRPRIALRHGLTGAEIEVLLAELAANAALREPAGEAPRERRGDGHVLALLAIDSRGVLVTGDLALRRRLPDRAFAPAEFLARWPLEEG